MLSLSSRILSDLGIPSSPPCQSVISIWYGKWEKAGVVHKLNEIGRYRIHIYPLSFVDLALKDTVEVISTFDRTLSILTPKPPMYMSSLIRYLLQHPVGDNSRFRIEYDLVSFISSYILRDKPLNTKEMEEEESEEDFQRRVEEGVQWMKTWDWGATEEKYLIIAERVVRYCPSIQQLSDC